MKRLPLPTLLLLLAACAHAPATSPAARNVEILQPGGEEDAALQVARVLPDALGRVERWGSLPGPVVVRIQPTALALAAAAGRPGDTWLRGWARPGSVDLQSPRTWSRGRASDAAVATLLSHELTHCLLFQRIGGDWARRDVPPWFEEGMASFTAGERHARADASALAPPSAGRPLDAALAYGTADRAFRYLVARHGEDSVRGVLDGLAGGQGFASAFQAATGSTVAAFGEALRAHLRAATAIR
ncbi:MAG: hypothetical protein H6Q88_661 [Anaeromyxobacteraceae bacterium]|nr:hypothetical protein [Anaeromyxobacteraceae bacterium]